MPDGKDYEIEVGGKTYELHSDKPLTPADIQGVVGKFKKQSASSVTTDKKKPAPSQSPAQQEYNEQVTNYEEMRRQHDRSLLAPLFAVADPLMNAAGAGLRGLSQMHIPGVTKPPGQQGRVGLSPHQQAIDAVAKKHGVGGQIAAGGQQSLLRQATPDFMRQIDRMPETGGAGFEKGVFQGVEGLTDKDNLLIMAAMAHPAIAGNAIIGKALQGVFGVQIAKGVGEDLVKYQKSGHKDTAALGRASAGAAAGAGLAFHAVKEALGKGAGSAPKETDLAKSAQKDTLVTKDVRTRPKPNYKPKEDAKAKFEREKARLAPRERATLAAQTTKKVADGKSTPEKPTEQSVYKAEYKRVLQQTGREYDAMSAATKAANTFRDKQNAPTRPSVKPVAETTASIPPEKPKAVAAKPKPAAVKAKAKAETPKPEEKANAVQKQSPDTGVPRKARQKVGLQEVEQGNKGQEKPTAASKAEVVAEAKPMTPFVKWADSRVDRSPTRARVYDKAADLYRSYKADHPGTTREQFGQMMQELASDPEFEIVTPSAGLPESQIFTFKDSTGKPVRVAGVRPAGVKTGAVAKPSQTSKARRGFIDLGPIIQAARHGRQSFTDVMYGDKAALTQESPKALEHTNEYENARGISKLEQDKYLPRVTAHLGPEDKAKFGGYLLADRMLDVKNKSRQVIAEGPKQRSVLLKAVRDATKVRDAAILTHDPHAINQAQRTLNEAQAASQAHLKKVADAKKHVREVTLDRGANALHVTMPDGSVHVIKEADIKPFLDKPEIQEAIKQHAAAEAILNRNQRAQGNAASISTGHYLDVYFPGHVADTPHGSSGKGGAMRPAASLASNPDAKGFRGTGLKYETDYNAVMRKAMGDSQSRAAERQMHLTNLAEGVEIPYDESNPNLRRVDGKLEVKYKGKWEPGYKYSIQQGQSLDPRLPETVVSPSRLYAEVEANYKPHVDTFVDQVANNAFSKYMKLFLAAPADKLQHGAALGSRGSAGATQAFDPKDSRIVNGTKQVGRAMFKPYQSAINLIRFNSPNLYPEGLRHNALKAGAEAGILPHDFGDVGNTRGTPRNMRDRANYTLGRAGSFGHNTLYGDRGILANSITSVYKSFVDSGALKSPEGRRMMKQAMRETFNTYSATDQSKLEGHVRAIGIGTFIRTGVKNRTAEVSGGAHVYAGAFASRTIFTISAVKAVTGKYPWDIIGYKWGSIPVWKDQKTGEVLMLDSRIFDRSGGYPDQAMTSVLQGMYDVSKKRLSLRGAALEVGTELANEAAGPVLSGPVVQAASAVSGKLPWLYPDKTLSGVEIADSPVKKLGLTPKRAMAVAGSVLPLGFLVYDPAHEAVASTPKGEAGVAANFWLRWIGAPQLKLPTDPNVVEKRRAAAEKGAQKADAKAMGTYQPKAKGRSRLGLPALPRVRMPR